MGNLTVTGEGAHIKEVTLRYVANADTIYGFGGREPRYVARVTSTQGKLPIISGAGGYMNLVQH